jgi:hypothetical protein
MTDSQFDTYDEIRILRKLIDKYGKNFPQVTLDDLEHYFGVGENEISFEYFFLEMLERDVHLDAGEKDEIRKLGLHLKMDENDWNDHEFWQKFEAYLSKQPD